MFQASVLGMRSQSQAMAAISGNIANVATPAYKRADTAFATLLGRTWAGSGAAGGAAGAQSRQSDIAGVTVRTAARISEQGELAASDGELDLAIDGAGFFVLADDGGNTVFGRDGRFARVAGPAIAGSDGEGGAGGDNESYLADPGGRILQAWRMKADGSFPTDAASLAPVRIDAAAFASASRATSGAAVALNLPAGDGIGSQRTLDFDVIDSAGAVRPLSAVFTRTAANTWALAVTGGPGDQVSLSPANEIGFTALGGLNGGGVFEVQVGGADGGTARFALDLAGSTQFAGAFEVGELGRDGHVAGTLTTVGFDAGGYVVGRFSNGLTERLYRLPIATFANPDGLTAGDGGTWQASAASGVATIKPAGEAGAGQLAPQALESSNVDLADQFTRMIMTQNAYNSSATAFRTLDEVVLTARDLKR